MFYDETTNDFLWNLSMIGYVYPKKSDVWSVSRCLLDLSMTSTCPLRMMMRQSKGLSLLGSPWRNFVPRGKLLGKTSFKICS